MASNGPSAPSRPEVGDILLVIHDFVSRSADELSLAKGDRVVLVERDDEFGDGWFLGRHAVNDETGLFPEVYTRPVPKNSGPTNAIASHPSKPPTSAPEPAAEPEVHDDATTTATSAASTAASAHSIPEESAAASSASPKQSSSQAPTLPPLSTKPSQTPDFGAPSSTSIEEALAKLNNQDSHVLNETLNVIDEHITNLRSPASNGGLPTITDSGSEYSASIDHRMSYIQGEETDEEEEDVHTRAEVESWNPDDVAEFLFTAGVEKHHCEVFRDQEISGEVLLGMDQSSLFIKALDLGSVGRRLKT